MGSDLEPSAEHPKPACGECSASWKIDGFELAPWRQFGLPNSVRAVAILESMAVAAAMSAFPPSLSPDSELRQSASVKRKYKFGADRKRGVLVGDGMRIIAHPQIDKSQRIWRDGVCRVRLEREVAIRHRKIELQSQFRAQPATSRICGRRDPPSALSPGRNRPSQGHIASWRHRRPRGCRKRTPCWG